MCVCVGTLLYMRGDVDICALSLLSQVCYVVINDSGMSQPGGVGGDGDVLLLGALVSISWRCRNTEDTA